MNTDEPIDPYPPLVDLARAALAMPSTRRCRLRDVLARSTLQGMGKYPEIQSDFWAQVCMLFHRAEQNEERRLIVEATSSNTVDAEACAEALAITCADLVDALVALPLLARRSASTLLLELHEPEVGAALVQLCDAVSGPPVR